MLCLICQQPKCFKNAQRFFCYSKVYIGKKLS